MNQPYCWGEWELTPEVVDVGMGAENQQSGQQHQFTAELQDVVGTFLVRKQALLQLAAGRMSWRHRNRCLRFWEIDP